jgi:hypothetical protein
MSPDEFGVENPNGQTAGFGQDPRKGHGFAVESTVRALSEVCPAHAQQWRHDQYCETAREP